MDKKLIIEQIRQNLDALIEQTHQIIGNEKRIPQIEIDIVMGNIRSLYERYILLDTVNKQKAEIKQEEAPVVEKTFHEEVFAIEPEPILNAETSVEIKQENIIVPVEEHTKDAIPEIMEEIQQKPVAEQTLKKIPKGPVDLFSGQNATVADKFKDDKKSINQKLADNKESKSIASKMQQQHITDLKSAIGINEKFQFINELFDGSMQEYTNAINKLNQIGSYEEALLYMNILSEQYKWKVGSIPCKKFEELLQRRFI